MHGFAINFLLGANLKDLSARLAYSRPLREIKEDDTIT